MKNPLLLLLVFCVSCEEQVKHGKPRAYSIPNGKMESVILILNNATCINGSAVGAAGARTPEYDSYEWLQKNGPDSLLIDLAGYSNPYTRTYAFMALCKRQNPVTIQLFEKNLSDTTTINVLDGCIFSQCKLNDIWLTKVQPLMRPDEFQALAKKVHPGYRGMSLCMVPD